MFMKKTKEKVVELFLVQGGIQDVIRQLKWYQFPSRFLFKRELKRVNEKIDKSYK